MKAKRYKITTKIHFFVTAKNPEDAAMEFINIFNTVVYATGGERSFALVKGKEGLKVEELPF